MRVASSLIAACLAAAATLPAAADSFTMTSGADTISFTLPASPSFNAGPFALVLQNISVTADNVAQNETVVFFLGGQTGGGLEISSPSGILVDQKGPQIFSGPLSAPVFNFGQFIMTNQSSPAGFYSEDFTLVVGPDTASATTPEPSSLVLLATGVLGAAGAFRKRLATR